MNPDAKADSNSVFDREAAMQAVGDDLELVSEMAELYLEDVDQLVEQIRESVGSRDADALRRSAHQLKGSSSNFQAKASVAAAQRLENMGRDGEWTDVEATFATLVSEIDRLKPELEKLSAP